MPLILLCQITIPGQVEVDFYSTHEGHENDIQYLFLRPRDKDIIADKIAKG